MVKSNWIRDTLRKQRGQALLMDGRQPVRERDGQSDSDVWFEKLKRMGENDGRAT